MTITAKPDGPDKPEMPSYKTPGRVLVRVLGAGENYRWESEVLDYDPESSVFWIEEGVGFDFWFDSVDFPRPGVFVVENIRGRYFRGDGWSTDDDEEWYYGAIRPATEEEIRTEALS